MNVGIKLGIGGSYRAQLVRRDGTIKQDTGWRKNLILNQGFAYWVSSATFSSRALGLTILNVGTGDTAPSPTDTSLENYLAEVTGGDAVREHVQESGIAYGHIDRDFLFDFGEANGNLRELGLEFGSSSDVLFSRALFTDINGDPITIEKTSEDQLRVTYRLTYAVPMVEDSEVVDVTVDGSPVSTTIKTRPQRVNRSIVGASTSARAIALGPGQNGWNAGINIQVYPDNTPPGSFVTDNGPASAVNTVTVNSPTVSGFDHGESDGVWWYTRVLTIPTGSGNVSGGEIGAMTFNLGSGSGGTSIDHPFLCLFDPKIPKDNTRRIVLRQTVYLTRIEDES
jgi:hypothetical protein